MSRLLRSPWQHPFRSDCLVRKLLGKIADLCATSHKTLDVVAFQILRGAPADDLAEAEEGEAVGNEACVDLIVRDQDDGNVAKLLNRSMVFRTSICCFCPSAEVGSSRIRTLAPK